MFSGHISLNTNNCAALQIGDKYRVTTPVNWRKGDDVIVHPSVSNDEAKTLFPEHTVHKVSPHWERVAWDKYSPKSAAVSEDDSSQSLKRILGGQSRRVYYDKT